MAEPIKLQTFDPRPDIRLIAADMDGTLLDDAKALHEHFWPLVEELFARGVLFCVASGRQYANLYARFRDVADEMVFLAENGAYVVHGTQEVSSRTLDPALVDQLIRAVRSLADAGADVGTVVCGKRAAYLDRVDGRFRRQVDEYYASQQVVADLLERPEDGILKVTVYDFQSAEHEPRRRWAASVARSKWWCRGRTGSTSWIRRRTRARVSAACKPRWGSHSPRRWCSVTSSTTWR